MTAPNPSTALAQVVIDELVQSGVRRFVASPGSRSAASVIAASTHEDTELRMILDERAAGFFALGAGRQEGVPAAVICTSGSAVGNLTPAVLEADAGGVPLLLLTSDRPPELHHTGANQTMSQAGFFGERSRFSVTLGPAEDRPDAVRLWRTTVDRAFTAALGSPPGPVHINLVFREPTSPVTDDGRFGAEPFQQALGVGASGPHVTPVKSVVEPLLPDDLIDEAIARRGVVVCGAAPIEAAVSVGEALGWPVLAEARAGGRSHRVVTAYQHLLHRPDLQPEMVIRLGAVGTSPAMLGLLASEVPQVMVDDHGRWWDPHRSATWSVRADYARFAAALAERVGDPRDPDWRDRWMMEDTEVRGLLDDVMDTWVGLTSAIVARDVAAMSDEVLVVGSSLPIRDVDDFAWVTPPRVISNRGLSGIDGFVSTALGVTSTGCAAVGLCGDLTVLHDSNGFLVEDRPALPIVVVDNNGGRIFERLPHFRHAPEFERLFVTPHDLDLSKLATLHGLDYRLVERVSDLKTSLSVGEETSLVHVPIDPERDREARAELKRMVRSPS